MTSSSDQFDQIRSLLAETAHLTHNNATAIAHLTEAQETTDAKVGVLVTAIDTLAEEVRRIVNYLESQSGNGRSAG